MVYSREFNEGSGNYWSDDSIGYYKPAEHPQELAFTFDEVTNLHHEHGSAGTAYMINVTKDVGGGRVREYYGIHLHIADWLRLFKREMDRARQGLPLTRYLAQRAKSVWWVNPKLCNPVIDSSQYTPSQARNQNKMVA